MVDPSKDVRRSGKDFSFNPIPTDDVADWRTRIFLVWFCFLYENLSVLRRPMAAIEELILEFKAPAILDSTAMRLGTIYAGAGASDQLSTAELRRELALLLRSYKCAVALLVPAIDNAGDRS